MTDLYSTLGLDKGATPEAIKKSYRQRRAAAHPDKGGTVAGFQALQLAYEVLSDDTRRQSYDETGNVKTEPPREQRIISEVAGLMFSLLDQIEPETTDLPAVMIKIIEGKILEQDNQISGILQQCLKRERAKARLTRKTNSPNILATLLDGSIAQLKQSIATISENQQVGREMVAFISEYQYRLDGVDMSMFQMYGAATRSFTW